jgi:putative ABC transport system permease protein
MRDLWQDIRYGIRRLIASPGFTTVSVLTLALGIGATSSIFTLVNAILIRSLPYRQPDRIVYVGGMMRQDDGTVTDWPAGYLDLRDLAHQGNVFTDLALVTNVRSFNLTADAEVEHITGEMVSSNYFHLLGAGTTLGRTFLPEEDAPPDGTRVAVLSDDLWQRRFGADRTIVGRTIMLSEQPYQVIGVMKPGFRGLTDQAEVWLPLTVSHALYGPHYTEMRQWRWLRGLARLRPGVSIAQAQRAMDGATAAMQKEFPADDKGMGVKLTALPEVFIGDLRFQLFVLLAAAAFVLLIACTNVANLLLARGSSRRKEMSLRSALGAGSFRLVRQLLTESLLLSLFGCVLGLLLADWFARLLVGASGMTLPSFFRFEVDPVVVAVTLAISVAAGVVFGLVPALMAAKINLQEDLKEGAQSTTVGTGRRLFQSGLVIAEVAVALVLLAGAGLMIKGFRQFLRTDLGFRTENLLTLRLDLTAERYADNERVFALERQVLDRVRALPGVTNAAFEGPGYPTGGWYGGHFQLADRPEQEPVAVIRHHVSPGYFQTLGVHLLAGRDFTPEDRAGAPPVLIIGDAMAKRYWPGQNPIGKRLKGGNPKNPEITVIGMTAPIKHGGLLAQEGVDPDVYIPSLQSPPRSPSILTLLVRTSVPPKNLVNPIRGAVKEAASDLAVYDAATMQELLDRQTAQGRFLAFLMTVFSLLALTLAAIGVYGVISYIVSQRTREVGIRVALGARKGAVIGLVVRRAVSLVALGVAAGLVLAFAFNRFVQSQLYGVSPNDPATLAGTALVLLLVALAASFLPARRATRIEPVITLRAE